MDVVETIKKLDIKSNSIIVMRISERSQDHEVQPIIERLNEWLIQEELESVQVFLVTGPFDVDMISNDDMRKCGWYRRDDL